MAEPELETMAEFAEYVGVSRPTVSKYFREPDNLRESTKELIKKGIEETGYTPNILAANLQRQESKIIGVIIPNLNNPAYISLVGTIDAAIASRGYLTLMLDSFSSPELELEAIQTCVSMDVAGCIILPVGGTEIPIDESITSTRSVAEDMPLVSMIAPMGPEVPYVGTDNKQASALMVNYLCRTGEPPVYLDVLIQNYNGIHRRTSYIETMKALGHEPMVLDINHNQDEDFDEVCIRKTKQILSQSGFPSSSVLCSNDRLALAVISAAYQSGIKVGRGKDCEFRVAGFNNLPLTAYSCPPLTTIAQNTKEIGRAATELLLMQLQGYEIPIDVMENHSLHNGQLILRDSA